LAPPARPRPALLAGVLVLFLSFAIWTVDLLTWPELISVDLRFQVRGRQSTGDQIALVPITSNMFDLGIYSWPLKRDIYTHALANLRRAGAVAVGVDVLMESTTADDPGLTAELSQWHGRAIMAYRRAASKGETVNGNSSVNVHGPVTATARGAYVLPGGGALAPKWPRGAGYVEVTQDQDGVVHSLVPTRRVAGITVDSLPMALARLLKPGLESGYPAGKAVQIDYAGPPGAFPTAADLDVVAAGLFDPSAVAGKVILIGSTDPAQKDLFPGPYDDGAALTPGVEVNADALWTLLGGRAPQPVSAPLNAVTLLVLGGLAIGLGLRLRPLLSLPTTLASIALFLVLGQALFAKGILLDEVGPLLAYAGAYLAVQGARFAESLRDLHRVEALFGRYVSPAVVRGLVGKQDELRLGGQRRDISVLFSDIRGFTTFAEHLPPEEVGAMLNEYFTAMVDVIFTHGGTVDKFVGDAIMAVFNAPLEQPDHAQRAVATALAMQDTATVLATRWESLGRPPLTIGIGVQSGPAVVGNFGADRRLEYTALGDTVNVASRLESLSKDLGCAILVGAGTVELLAELGNLEPLGLITVRGRAEPLDLYGVRRTE
jgi:adenylate cyclase